MKDELSQKLASVQSDLRGLREDRATAEKDRDEAKEKYAEVVASGEDDTEVRKEAMEKYRVFAEIGEKIEALGGEEKDLLTLTANKEASQRGNGNGRRPTSAPPGIVDPFDGWHADEMLADESVQQQLTFISNSTGRFGSMEVGTIASREAVIAEIIGQQSVMAADIDVTPHMRRGAYRGIQPALYRPFSFLSLIPTGTTDGNLVPYTQENPVTGAALEVAEGLAKPEAGLTFTDVDAPVRTIAAWMKTRKQVLSDFAALRSTMDTRLRYLVQKRLEEQVLAGDGSGVNLRGIMNTSGIGLVAYQATVSLTELILSGITNVFLNDGAADGIVLNPIDWQKALTEKAHYGGGAGAAGTAGSYEYIGGGPFGTTPSTIWGVRCVPSQVIAAGKGLVGDFSLGSQLLIREGVNVLFSDSDQDDFIKNRVTLLAEMRAALLVWRPSLFQDVRLA